MTSSASWDLVQQLAQEFFNVQQQSCSLRLSERNWIEIVDRVFKVHNMTVVYTKDGKEMVTPDQLLHEIKMFLNMHEGRASFGELQDALGVDYSVVEERCMELVRRSGILPKEIHADMPENQQHVWRCWRVLDQVVTNDYCERLTADIASELEIIGKLSVGTLASRYQLPAEFIRKLLPTQSGESSSAKCVIDGDAIYSANFIKRATCRLVGFLSATVRPQRVSAYAQQTGLPERILTAVMDDAISSGRLVGSVQQRMFVPKVFTEAQRECMKSALSAVYIDASVLRRLGIVGDVADVIKREWAPSDEPVPVGSSGFIRKSALERLNATVEEACKKVSNDATDGAANAHSGWLDTHGAIAVLGGSTGSIPPDIVEQLIRTRGRLMELIDCAADDKRGKVNADDSSSSDADENSSGDERDNNENEEECSIVAVAPWLVEKCTDALYHLAVAKINERKQQALSAVPPVPSVLLPSAETATPSETSDTSLGASTTPELTVNTGTPSGAQGAKRKQQAKLALDQRRKGGATPAASVSQVPKLYRVSRRRLVRLLRRNRTKILTSDFPQSAIKPFVFQHIHPIVAKRLCELAAMTPKSNAAATANSAKILQQGSVPVAPSTGNLTSELPKLIVTLASSWRGVTQQLITGTGGNADRDRRAVATYLRETVGSQLVALLRSLPLAGKDQPSSGGHSAELLSESVNSFENNFTSGDVDGAIESLKQLFALPFARNALNSLGLSATAFNSVLSTATSTASAGTGSSNRNKGDKQKSAANTASLGVTVEQLRSERLAAGIEKLRTMVGDESVSATDPLLLPNVLLLVSSLLFEKFTGELIACPGRLVPTLVTFLKGHKSLDSATSAVLDRALSSSQKQLRAGSSPAPSAADQKALLQELVALVDKS